MTEKDKSGASNKKSDESWKEKAAGEKRQLEDEYQRSGGVAPELPPASFDGLLQDLSFQAMMALGRIPNPMSGQPTVDLGVARYHIDMLEILQKKTRGNLEPAEDKVLSDVVHGLRLAYLEAAKAPPPAGTPGGEAGDDRPPPGDAGPKIII